MTAPRRTPPRPSERPQIESRSAKLSGYFEQRLESPLPLHVAHLIQYFHVGGIERLVLALGRGLAARGVRTTVFAYVSNGPFEAVYREAGLETVFLETRPGVQALLPARLLAEFARRRVDLVHTHHLGPALYGALPARTLGRRVVHTEHSVELYDTERRRLAGRLLPRLAHVVTVSHELAAYRREHFGDAPEVIENGVEVPPVADASARAAARELLQLPPDALVVGSVARLAAEKAPALLLEAFQLARAQAPQRDLRLVLVGDGSERALLERRVAEAGLQEVVRLVGRRDDVERLLPAFDVFGLASEREGLPLAVLEAMAHGIPAVTTAVGALPALLSGGAGRLAPSGDAPALAQALLALVPDADRRAAGDTARRLVLEKHSSYTMLDRYSAVYARLSGKPVAGATP